MRTNTCRFIININHKYHSPTPPTDVKISQQKKKNEIMVVNNLSDCKLWNYHIHLVSLCSPNFPYIIGSSFFILPWILSLDTILLPQISVVIPNKVLLTESKDSRGRLSKWRRITAFPSRLTNVIFNNRLMSRPPSISFLSLSFSGTSLNIQSSEPFARKASNTYNNIME